MSSVCKSAVGCVDARVPVPVPVRVRATYVNLYKWPESDAEFVRGLTEKNHTDHTAARGNTNNAPVRTNATARFGPSPAVVDSYSCRQIFLKSYTFTKKETVTEKTVRCFGKVKEKAAACGRPRSDSGEFSDDGAFIGRATNDHQNQKNKKTNTTTKNNKNKKKSKGCVKRLKEASYSALSSIFHGLLSCSVGVDVEDQRFQGS